MSSGGSAPRTRGAPRWWWAPSIRRRDQPHRCGEQRLPVEVVIGCLGTSPACAGAWWVVAGPVFDQGISPTRAGSTYRHPDVLHHVGDQPRTCGRHSIIIRSSSMIPGSALHVQGAPLLRRLLPVGGGPGQHARREHKRPARASDLRSGPAPRARRALSDCLRHRYLLEISPA